MMDIYRKQIIELTKGIQYRLTPLDGEWDKINITRIFHRDDYKSLDKVIDLLKKKGGE